MAVPTYEQLMLPALLALSDGQPCASAQLRDRVADLIELSDADRSERIPSGAPVFDNRLHWAVTYLVQAGVLERPRRGVVRITQRGRDLAAKEPVDLDNSSLSQFPEFVEFRQRKSGRSASHPGEPGSRAADLVGDPPASAPPSETPQERLAAAIEEANTAVAREVLQRVREREPEFLERLVLQLLRAMGYGGRHGSSDHLGRSGDQGIDGVIRQDSLGLDRVYVQAKRYAADRPIGRPDIQAFVGALQGQHADRGIFITTSRFTPDAEDYAERVPARIVLIDATALGDLLVRYGVGVQTREVYELVQIDEDVFDE